MTLLSIETADDVRLSDFGAAPDILISSGRAVTLKLSNQRDAAAPDAPIMIAHVPWLDIGGARALADPATDLANPLQGPYSAIAVTFPDAAAAALSLARIAGLLPAFFIREGAHSDTIVSAEAIAAYEAPERLAIVTRARLPVRACETAEIVAFRSPEQLSEHIALIIGAPNGQPPLVRLHSECLTGDVLGSLKCDCGPQLDAALAAMADEARLNAGWGVLLYLRQEGRGIGLINKLRAYQLQDQGFDTVDANQRLGLPTEARDFPVAARMLQLLGVGAIRLMTNNPAKVAALSAAGVEITERVPHQLPANPHNARYLDTKRDRSGHLL